MLDADSLHVILHRVWRNPSQSVTLCAWLLSMFACVQAVMYQGMLDARFDAAEARAWTSSLVPHHQWMIVSVEHALMLVALRDKILQVRWAR
jgi:hypothetical protein